MEEVPGAGLYNDIKCAYTHTGNVSQLLRVLQDPEKGSTPIFKIFFIVMIEYVENWKAWKNPIAP